MNKRGSSILKPIPRIAIIALLVFSFTGCFEDEKLKDGGLRIGWAMEDITPEGPVSLFGQYFERISAYNRFTISLFPMAEAIINAVSPVFICKSVFAP
jgi:hypothetical protein